MISDEESSDDNVLKESLISSYFLMGLRQYEILLFLSMKHNIHISERTLKRILSKLKLFRRKHYSNLDHVIEFLRDNMNVSSQLHGYKWMHLKCLQSGLVVRQEDVRNILNRIDPEGIYYRSRKRLRRRQYFSKGPNFLWHIDSYDKLKPYGICINGCIDGFSRFIMWLKCTISTSDPKIIANHYVKTVKRIGGCPRVVRTDLGTENSILRQFQEFLFTSSTSRNDNVSLPPFIYGTSQANQRIEAWWSFLRKHMSQFWINLFQNLKDNDYFSGSFIDKSLIQFCFLKIISAELKTVVCEWNTHIIRKSKNAVSHGGKPLLLYQLPELYSTEDYVCKVPQDVIELCSEEIILSYNAQCDEDIHNICSIIMEEKNLVHSNNPFDAINLYITLRSELTTLLN